MAEFPFRSLRDWLKFLEEHADVVHIKEEVDINKGHISAVTNRAYHEGQKVPLFENIRGYPGWTIVGNATFAGRRRMAWAMGVPEKGFMRVLADRMGKQVPPMEVDTGPCKEIKITGDDVDLTKFPIPFSGDLEGVPNITAGLSNKLDPEMMWQNVAIRRLCLKGKNKLSEFINPVQQDFRIWLKYREKGEKMPVAYCVGTDPLCIILSCCKCPVGVCEYDFWGAFTGKPLEVVRCEDSDLYVPASAEIVLEGTVDPDERVHDGPFPEFCGFYDTMTKTASVTINTITMRKDPYYLFIDGTEGSESIGGSGIVGPMSVFREMMNRLPGLIDVEVISWQIVVFQVEKKVAKRIPNYGLYLANLMHVHMPYIPGIIVVDEDVDLSNRDAIFAAMMNKCMASKDVHIIKGNMGVFLNPIEFYSPGGLGTMDHWVFDCTEPPSPYDKPFKRGRSLPPNPARKWADENWEKLGFKKI